MLLSGKQYCSRRGVEVWIARHKGTGRLCPPLEWLREGVLSGTRPAALIGVPGGLGCGTLAQEDAAARADGRQRGVGEWQHGLAEAHF